MTFTIGKTQLILVFLISQFFMMGMIGCSDDDDNNGTTDDLGVALESRSYQYANQLHIQIEQVRTELIDRRTNISELDFESVAARNELQRSLDNIQAYLALCGLMDVGGRVAQSVPENLAGEQRGDRPEVIGCRTTENPTISAVWEEAPDDRHFDYLVPIHTGYPEGVYSGALWGECTLDTMLNRSIVYTLNNDTLGRDVFILESDGRIIFSNNPDLFGENLTDAARFGTEVAALGAKMVADSAGHDLYDATDAPGAGNEGGERHVGWSRMSLVTRGAYWIIGLTQSQ